MLKKERGFAGLEALLIVVIVGAIAGLGYWVYSQKHKQSAVSSNSSQTAQSVKSDGTTKSVEDQSKQAADSEAGIDNKYDNTDQTNAKSANQAAQNIGGAYDESTF